MDWPSDTAGAKLLQKELKKHIVISPLMRRPLYLAGVDAAFSDHRVFAVASLFSYPDIEPAEDSYAVEDANFPYVPGFLAFREGHAIISALKKLAIRPDVLIVDGQGIAHPSGIGIASHLGILIDLPSIGCAKSRLIGDYKEPGKEKGVWSVLECNREVIGAALRTRPHVKPVFVSPGHRIDLAGSIEIVMKSVTKFRIPEPLRRADALSKRLKKTG